MGIGGSSPLCQQPGPRFCRALVCPFEWAFVDVLSSEKRDWKHTYINIPHPDCFNFTH